MDILIRNAVIDDYSNLCEIYSELDELHRRNHPEIFVTPNSNNRTKEYITKLIENDSSSLLVAELDSKVVGLAECYVVHSPSFPIIKERTWIQLDSIAVRKEYYKNNIGTLLLNKVIKWAKARNVSRIELKVYNFNKNAITFYDSKGFKDLNKTMCLDL